MTPNRGPEVVPLEPFLGEVLEQMIARWHGSESALARRAGLSLLLR